MKGDFKMKEYYYMNKDTGELKSGTQAIKDFYSVPRGYMDAWTDEWILTNTEISADELEPLANPMKLLIQALNI